METDFKIIAAFLDRFDQDVQGHELQDPPAEVRDQIRSFARGRLEASQREMLVQALHEHPDWIALLASEVKALRANLPPDPQS